MSHTPHPIVSQLPEISCRAAAATEGPWAPRDHGFVVVGAATDPGIRKTVAVLTAADVAVRAADTAFVAHARTDVPALVAGLLAVCDRLDRIAAWHAREKGPAGTVGDFCVECGKRWPCDTRRMAEGAYGEGDEAWA